MTRRWRRRAALLAALTLVAAACDSAGEAASTTATAAPATTSSTAAVTATTTVPRGDPAIPTFPDDNDPVPTDGDVRIGTLPNGLTYYIRENRAPGQRAQLRLAVKAGSIQEPDDQRGAAHYLEHMMFNGTERFPANELVLVLQRFGVEFGADINAYTTYDETVYQLELPTDDPETVAAGFDVLEQWAAAATLDPAEVDLERGVLLEEWRLRDQGFWGRYFAGVTDKLLAGTRYAERSPLADPEQLETTTPEGLRVFYETWYRPDTMAVVAVGDFDADEIETLIVDRFAPIPAPTDPEPVPAIPTSTQSRPSFFVLADPEYPQAWAELNYPLPADDDATVGGVRRGLALDIAWSMIVTRLDEDSRRGDTPFFSPSFAANPLIRAQISPGLAALADPEDLAATTSALLGEVKRAVAHGFSQAEFDRAITDLGADFDLEFDERATTQDRQFADAYVENFLAATPIASAQDWHDLRLRLLEEMTPDQVWNTFAATVTSTSPLVIIVGPEAEASALPTEEELAEILAEVDATDYGPRPSAEPSITALMERPEATPVRDRGLFPDTALTELTLDNGMRVVFLPTTIRREVVVIGASSPGGWALVDSDDAAEAQLISDVVATSGVGDFDQVDLERFLAGRVVSVTPFIDENTEGFSGETATGDLETLLQLVHLYMVSPRFDESALDVVIGENLPFAANPEQVPDLAVEAALAEIRFGGDPRFGVLPTEEDLNTFDLERAAAVYRDRFDDPGDFVFVLVGDFEENAAEDLVRRYLGSIPGPGTAEPFVDVRPDPPEGVELRTVEAGTGRLGGVTLLYSTVTPLDSTRRIEIDLLELVLQQRLTRRIREELSASYSPFARAQLIEDAEQSVEFRIQISGDPDGLDEVVAATLAEVADLRTSGPTADELAIAAEQLTRDYELFSNEGLVDAVVFSAQHPGESLLDTVDRIDQTQDPTITDIRDLARALLPADRYIEVRLVPAS